MPRLRIARELDAVIDVCYRPAMIVSDNGTELTSNDDAAPVQEHLIEWH